MAARMPDPDQLPDEVFEKMNLTREKFREIHARAAEREKRTPKVGAPAPDFALERLTVSGDRTGETVRLSDHFDRPVGLIFGSYT